MREVISLKAGFQIYFLTEGGERVLKWIRSGKITTKTVEAFEKIVENKLGNVEIDKLIILFKGKPKIDEDAYKLLSQKYGKVEVAREKVPTSSIAKTVSGNAFVVWSHGRLAYKRFSDVKDKDVWLLAIWRMNDRVTIISDFDKNNFYDLAREALIIAVPKTRQTRKLFIVSL